jgi:hypothetical protein
VSVPSQAQLYDEVDRLYHERHPDAPYKLDRDDPEHRPWVERWLEIRDDVVNEWTNQVFFTWFPSAGKLDPNDPADGEMIRCWLDIRDQIRDDASPQIDIAAVAAAMNAGSSPQEATVPHGTVEVIVQDPPEATGWEDETIVDRIFDAQLTALAQWEAAIDMFDEVVEAAADDEATPNFTRVARDYFLEEVIGIVIDKGIKKVSGTTTSVGGKIVGLWGRLTAEYDRARSAELSTKIRDFLIAQHLEVAAIKKTLDEVREELMPEVQRLAYEASRDSAAAAAYGDLRPALVELATAAMSLRDQADPKTYYDVLVEEWLRSSSFRDELGKPAGLRIDLRDDFSIRSASLTGPNAKKLGDQLEKNNPGGINLLELQVPKFIRYDEGEWSWAAVVQLDSANNMVAQTTGAYSVENQEWLERQVKDRGLPLVDKLD